MKAVGLLLAVFLVVVLAVGFFWPRGSRKLQEATKRAAAFVRTKARRRSSGVGDRVAEATEKSARATQETAHAGRRAHDEVFNSKQGAAQDEDLVRRHGRDAERGAETS